MSDLFALYIIVGLLFTTLSLFSGNTTQILAEKSFFWSILWAVLLTTLWFPAFIISVIIIVKKSNKESEK